MDNTHDLMVNILRSRKPHFREESDLNSVIRLEYSVDVNICIFVKGPG